MKRLSQVTFAAALSLVLLACPATAQDGGETSEAENLNRKDPSTATLLSVVIPGGGQIYADQTLKGIGIMGVSALAPAIGAAASSSSVDCSGGGFSCETNNNYAPLYLGLAASLGSWIYGIIDADDAARAYNSNVASRMSVAPKVAYRGGQASYGMQVSLSF